MKKLLPFAMLLPVISAMLLVAPPRPGAQTQSAPPSATPSQAATPEAVTPQAAPQPYTPKIELCADGSGKLCPIVAAYIFEPNPQLQKVGFGYNGLFGQPPTKPWEDLQTHFDNMSWQMFVALNWAANAVSQPAATGLTQSGPRVWQNYRKVSALFGNSPVRAGCTPALAQPAFYIGSEGNGKPAPNNEEYLQASTNRPLIDVNGNWTIFERRVNDIEANYLLAPGGQAAQKLTTIAGQKNFIKNPNNKDGVQFTSSATVPDGRNGSIEIKASWRVIDRAAGDDPSRYLTQNVFIAVAGDLVRGGRPFCRTETVGLVGMHILQRNPVDPRNVELLPQWIWASFEHVDNAPLAQTPCNVRNGCGTIPATNWINRPSCGPGAAVASSHYSFFNQSLSGQATNVVPLPPGDTKTQYPWNPQRPYAKGGTTAATAMPQTVRCWEIYPTTASLNGQWQKALGTVPSVFANYMLIGTQWGGNVEAPTPPNPMRGIAVPGMLSNTTLETYIQNNTGFNNAPGSCVACHAFSKLPADGKTSGNFSFLPLMAKPSTARSQIQTAQ